MSKRRLKGAETFRGGWRGVGIMGKDMGAWREIGSPLTIHELFEQLRQKFRAVVKICKEITEAFK